VLILHDAVSDKFEGTSLLRPDQSRDKEQYAQTKATVVAVGPLAWSEARYDASRAGIAAHFPEAGSRVVVGRYAGNNYDGADGRKYTVVNDEDIIAFLESGQ
jgi:co-chaperonin GroES (HSP10)